MKSKLTIFKIGGHVLENEEKLYQFLKDFSQWPEMKILVHGGGKRATEMAEKLKLEIQMVDGRRITDQKTLDIALMVYAGFYNKKITAMLQSLGVNALGLSGADANTLVARKRPVQEIDFGFVGDIKYVNHKQLQKFLDSDLVPVFCAVTHDGQGQLFNTNADTIATEIASSLSQNMRTELIFCFEKTGVLQNVKDDSTRIEHLTFSTFQSLKQKGIFTDGMIPKLDNAFSALRRGVQTVRITHFAQLNQGTKITLD